MAKVKIDTVANMNGLKGKTVPKTSMGGKSQVDSQGNRPGVKQISPRGRGTNSQLDTQSPYKKK